MHEITLSYWPLSKLGFTSDVWPKGFWLQMWTMHEAVSIAAPQKYHFVSESLSAPRRLVFQNETEGFIVSIMTQIKSEMAAGSLCHVHCTTNVIKYHEH